MILRQVFFAGAIMVASILLTIIYLHMPFSLSIQPRKTSIMKLFLNKGLKDEKLNINGTTKQYNSSEVQAKNLNHSELQNYKLILLYTPLFDRIPWPGLENSHNLTHFRGKPCQVTNCKISYDKNDLARSDAVIFHGRDMPSKSTMEKIPRNRNSKQRWVYFIHESPVFTYDDTAKYNNMFNWTMSYRRDSDFFVPYNYYSRLNSDEKPNSKDLRNYAEGKDKLIAWTVSNCGQLRDKVAEKLLQYVNITVFGACSKKFNQSNHCNRKSRDCQNLLKRFKFYLSFENAFCVDYVTEKYWYTPFTYDMVPVVLGSNYDSKIVIPGSYINVMDFSSLKALGSYLEYLDKNDTAYNMFFQWKTKFKLDYPNPWTCQMCADLNNSSLPVKVYDDMGYFWGINSTCGKNEDKIYKLLKT